MNPTSHKWVEMLCVREKDDALQDSAKQNLIEQMLKSARPYLILRAVSNDCTVKLVPCTNRRGYTWDEVLDEGYDPDNSPLGPVYWRIVKRNGERLYCSTFFAPRDKVAMGWGKRGIAHCDPVTGTAIVRIETPCSGKMENLPAAAIELSGRRAGLGAEEIRELQLDLARPRLVIRAWVEGDRVKLSALISEAGLSWDEVVEEGYHPENGPVGAVYWRIIRRAGEEVYCSTFQAGHEFVSNAWGEDGIEYCNPESGIAIALIEAKGPMMSAQLGPAAEIASWRAYAKKERSDE